MVLVDGNAMFNRPGPRLVDCFEFLVGLLHNRHDIIPDGYPWRVLQRDELCAEVAAWLQDHPGWETRVQQGPKPKDGAAAAAGGVCCSSGSCGANAGAAAAAVPAAAGGDAQVVAAKAAGVD